MTASSRLFRFGLIPYVGWLTLFMLGPLFFVLLVSFQEKGLWGGIVWNWTGSNYARALDPLYLSVFLSSLKLAIMTALSCLALAFPMSWFMATIRREFRALVLGIVLMPFISNFVVRTYALKFLIGVEGPLNRFFTGLGIIQTPLFLEDVRLAVWFGMVTNYLPFMVLPLYVALERFDVSLIESARDLGANSFQVFVRVVWPLAKPAVRTGFVLVFVPALGEFVIPDLLGGGKTMYMGNLLSEQFLKARDWPFGASLCVMMLSIVIFVSLVVRRRSDP
jgi:spermidine/putrescine transport system permease protein